MREESISVVVRLPADVVWDFLAEYDRVVKLGWDSASARRLSPSKRCQVRYKVQTDWEGLKSTYTVCLASSERPTTLTWSTSSGGARSSVRFDLRALNESSTHVAVTLRLDYGAALRALEPFAWGLMRPGLVRTINGLRDLRLAQDGRVDAGDSQSR